MKLCLVYIFPLNGQGNHGYRATKFLQTYHDHPPGLDHETVIVCNGGTADDETKFLFDSMPNVRLIEHDDSGMDCGGFQLAAKTVPADLMVFCGGNSYFKREGWMHRVVDSFTKFGDTLYGSTGSQGDMRFNVHPHVRTTGFWCRPELINRHPLRVTHNGLRYEWEHGASGLTTWVLRQNKMCYIVSWHGCHEIYTCNNISDGFRSGDGSNVLIGDRLCEQPYGSDPP